MPTPPKSPVPGLPPVRRYALYGAAAGMLAGLVYLASIEAPAEREVVIWRNFILGGCFLGLGCGVVRVLIDRRKSK